MNSNYILVNTETGEEIEVVLSENEAVAEDKETTGASADSKDTETVSKWSEEDFEHAQTGYDTPLCAQAIDNAVSYGLPTAVFGFAVVFFVLAVIMLIVMAFGKVFGTPVPKAAKKPAPKKNEDKAVSAESTPVVAAAPAAVSDDNGIVAAIMAAISSFRAANGEAGGFRVVSFKKRK